MLEPDIVLILLIAGSAAGLIAGLFGVGGGIVVIPGIILGSVGGSLLASHIPSEGLQYVFIVFAYGIAFTGAISYLVSGLKVEELPEGSLGFCVLPIALVLVVTTTIFAPLGVRLAHRLSSDRLQIVFGILLFAVTTQILFKWVL